TRLACKGTLRVLGKGDKIREIPIHPTAPHRPAPLAPRRHRGNRPAAGPGRRCTWRAGSRTRAVYLLGVNADHRPGRAMDVAVRADGTVLRTTACGRPLALIKVRLRCPWPALDYDRARTRFREDPEARRT